MLNGKSKDTSSKSFRVGISSPTSLRGVVYKAQKTKKTLLDFPSALLYWMAKTEILQVRTFASMSK